MNRSFFYLLSGLLLAAVTLTIQPAEPMNIPFEGQADAPEFPAELSWLNTDHAITVKELRGKVVLLDFWTYCCINCMHVIPDLKKLEAKYPRELVVIGVHSAKFENEKQTRNIREAIQRYEIEHPVINDNQFQVWRSYGARAWPTVVLVNPNGRIIGAHSGEGVFAVFDDIIRQTIEHFDAEKKIDRRPVRWKLEKELAGNSLLAFPGKIAADEKNGRLVFSDSNHNRIILATFEGKIVEVVGSGDHGLADGDFTAAKFFRPQGVCFDTEHPSLIFVADTENHAVRKIDLATRKVTTLAGNGQQARGYRDEGKGVSLNSPWDLTLVKGKLFVAMAGSHQLWTIDPVTGDAKIFAGTGRENIFDGPLNEASLAQPSGIASDGQWLYFADSEVSAVRRADLNPGGQVQTLIGQGLFEFGDLDGVYPKARLQHPLGVALGNGKVYVADTYNHKIKLIDPGQKQVATLIGTGKPGLKDGRFSEAQLNEPAGLCFASGKLFVADANNHAIRVCDLAAGTITTMQWKNPEKLDLGKPMARVEP